MQDNYEIIIGNYAFANCINLEPLDIPYGAVPAPNAFYNVPVVVGHTNAPGSPWGALKDSWR